MEGGLEAGLVFSGQVRDLHAGQAKHDHAFGHWATVHLELAALDVQGAVLPPVSFCAAQVTLGLTLLMT